MSGQHSARDLVLLTVTAFSDIILLSTSSKCELSLRMRSCAFQVATDSMPESRSFEHDFLLTMPYASRSAEVAEPQALFRYASCAKLVVRMPILLGQVGLSCVLPVGGLACYSTPAVDLGLWEVCGLERELYATSSLFLRLIACR